MNQHTLSALAILGGVFLAVQGGLNSNLGVLLKNPLLASVVAFLSSTIFAFFFVLLSCEKRTELDGNKANPSLLMVYRRIV